MKSLFQKVLPFWPLIAILLGTGALFFLLPKGEDERLPLPDTTAYNLGATGGELPWSQLRNAVRSPQLVYLRIEPRGVAHLRFRDDSEASSTFPSEEASSLAALAQKEGARVEIDPLADNQGTPPWVQILLAAILVGGILTVFIVLRRDSGGKMEARNTAAPRWRSKTTFRQVAGCDEAVEEVQEFVLFLRHPERFLRTGARMPSGGILYGPPGTGKTLLARALAGEAGVPFYHMAGSEAVNKYVGVGASNVRELFQKARASEEGAVIFIDEIDAIGRRRSGDGESSSRENDNTLNQLLVELDGFSGRDRIVVLGATNRLDTLDPALLRPGRLSRKIPVLEPDKQGRLDILKMYSRNKPLADDVDLPALAEITSGSTGADLADMVNEAAIQAARAGRDKITDADMREGHLRAIAGPERKAQLLDPEERRKVAFHEAGHVLCAELCPDHEKAERVTIVARGQAAGMAVWGQRDRALHSPEYVEQRLVSILGGRAAERVEFGTVSSGAANDLQQANELARTAIEDWGLSQKTGQLLSRSGHAISDQTRSLVDQEVEKMVADAFREAVDLLESNHHLLRKLAEALLQKSVLERADILSVIGDVPEQTRATTSSGPSLRPVIHSEEGPTPRKTLHHRAVSLLRSQRAKIRRIGRSKKVLGS